MSHIKINFPALTNDKEMIRDVCQREKFVHIKKSQQVIVTYAMAMINDSTSRIENNIKF